MLVWDRNMLVWDRNMLVWDGNMLVLDRNVHIRDQNMHLQCFGTGFRGLLDLDIDFWPDPGSMNKDPKHWSLLFTGNTIDLENFSHPFSLEMCHCFA